MKETKISFMDNIKLCFKNRYQLLNMDALEKEMTKVSIQMSRSPSKILDIQYDVLNKLINAKITNKHVGNL